MAGPIENITIKGFKSIENLVDLPMKSLNVLVGGNGSGKSNFVEVFRMINAMASGNFERFVLERGGCHSFLHKGLTVAERIEIEVQFISSGGGFNAYKAELSPTVKDIFAITELRKFSNGAWRSYGAISTESRLKEQKNETAQIPSRPGVGYYIYDSISKWRVYHFHNTDMHAPMHRPESMHDNKDGLRNNASNIAPFLLNLKNKHKGHYDHIVRSVQLIAPFFGDFMLKPENNGGDEKVRLMWQHKGSSYPMQPHHLSDGTIRFICLATALLQPSPPSTIIIDEPELGLHPAAITILAELMEYAAKEIQLIVSTQSPLLIDQFAVEDILVVNRENYATTVKRLNEKDFTEWLEDYSIGELWTKDVISAGPNYE